MLRPSPHFDFIRTNSAFKRRAAETGIHRGEVRVLVSLPKPFKGRFLGLLLETEEKKGLSLLVIKLKKYKSGPSMRKE